MRQVDKLHIQYHLQQLIGHCDSRIQDIQVFWDGDQMIDAIVRYAGGFKRHVKTDGLRLAEAFEKIMDAI